MRFPKRRRDDEQPVEEPVVATDADAVATEPASYPWTAPPGANTVVGQERPSFDPPLADPVVEGSAVELPEEPSSATVVGSIARPVAPEPLAMHKSGAPEAPPAPTQPTPRPDHVPFPVAEEPIAIVTPGPQPSPVTPLGDAAAAHASGHAPVPGPAWPEDVQKLAAERPELVVGAAFVGGLLAAMILRRLGN